MWVLLGRRLIAPLPPSAAVIAAVEAEDPQRSVPEHPAHLFQRLSRQLAVNLLTTNPSLSSDVGTVEAEFDIKWLRGYGQTEQTFSFETGRKCPTGPKTYFYTVKVRGYPPLPAGPLTRAASEASQCSAHPTASAL